MNKKMINLILIYIWIFLLCLAICSTNWALNTFAFLSFDETLFTLTTPIKSAESSILNSYLVDGLLSSILLSIPVYILFQSTFLRLKKKRRVFLGSILVTIIVFYVCLDKVTFMDYIQKQFVSSDFIEENYVDPKNVSIVFPEKKRNLIYIYVESFESSYFSKELGGAGEHNYLEAITDLTKNHIQFSDSDQFGGAISVPGTTWTSAAMVAHSSGIPLKVNIRNSMESPLLSDAMNLGDILEENGYHQMLMVGSIATFGKRRYYYKQHGNFEIYDYYTAIDEEKIKSDYSVWWGFEDSKLFRFAKEELVNLASSEVPFHFTLLTANTHTPNGYLEDDCPKEYETQYENVVACSASQLAEFITWIQAQDFYSNTTIVVVGDHISMQYGLYPKEDRRRIYNLFINSAIQTENTHNRKFCTMDFFPTTLRSIGVEIVGNRLGLGTDLFSDEKTLMEEVGVSTFQSEISKRSKFYQQKFMSF